MFCDGQQAYFLKTACPELQDPINRAKSNKGRKGKYMVGIKPAKILCLIFFILSNHERLLMAQPYLDTIIFGNSISETSHSFAGANTAIFKNTSITPTQTCRRGMTNNPATIYGGSLTFQLRVDPEWRNYFTVKLWGGDEPEGLIQDADMGRLYLYICATNFDPLANPTNFYQLGYRHEGDYSELNTAGYKPPLPGRFFYSTTILPFWMTMGRTNLTFTIQPAGRIFDLGGGGPPNGNYQFNMITNSRGIYQAYTHTDPALDPVGEAQGTTPPSTVRPSLSSNASSGQATMNSGGAFWNLVNGYYNYKLTQNVTNLSTSDVSILAMGYWATNFPGFFTNAAVVTKVETALDYYASNFYAGNASLSVSGGGNNGWGGNYGYLGWAVDILAPKLTNELDLMPGVYGTNVTRRQAWGDMLMASRDYGRLNRDDWNLSNQNLIANRNIYWANRGMLDVDDANAFSETNGQRYLLEAIGIQPWLGSDLTNGGHSYLFGTNYLMVSTKGLTHEFGYAGTSYGEMEFYAAEFYDFTGNMLFSNQCVKMTMARANFRRPTVDQYTAGSTYQAMEAIGIMAWRGADESDSQFADDISYGDRTLSGNGMRCAAATMNTNLIGYAKQMLNDGQYYFWLQKMPGSSLSYEWFKAFSDYMTVANAPDSGVRLPMTAGQADFAWADEDNGIVAINHGTERLWLSTYWEAHDGSGLNGIGRFLYETNGFDRYGDLVVTPEFAPSGNVFFRPNMVDLPYKTVYQPPDNPINAYTGDIIPQATLPALADDSDPFVGKADFWFCRYGNYLIGINRSAGTTYELPTPSNFTSATNLVTGQNMTGTINVAPQSTVVLYLTNLAGINLVPQTPLWLSAVGSSTPQVTLSWTPAPGATGYNVKRSTASGGPYTSVANVVNTNFIDTNVSLAGNYYYVVTGTNINGESIVNSMEASASAGLPPPWNNVDIGTPNLAGHADYFNGMFTVTGNGIDIGGTSDSCQYAYTFLTNNNDNLVVRWAADQPSQAADKVGIMFRAGTNANAMAAVLMFDSDPGFNNVRFACRTANGSAMNYSWNGPAIMGAPMWFKLQRVAGSTFSAFFSNDGLNWATVGSNSFSMTGTILAGMFSCARYNGYSYDTSTFDNVSVSSWTSVPPVPTNLTAVAGNALVGLNWNPVATATSYNVRRSLTSGSNYVIVASVDGTNAVDSGLSNGTTYYYVVSAVNAAGGAESGNSGVVSATPIAPPLAPTGLTATTASASQINIFWTSSLGATGYNIKSSLTNGGVYTIIATNIAGLNFANFGLTTGTRYYYVVSAINRGGESANSAQASAVPVSLVPPELQMSLNGSQLQFAWPADHIGWSLQVQTDSLFSGFGTNWFPFANSSNVNQISVPVVPTNGAVFYRLVFP